MCRILCWSSTQLRLFILNSAFCYHGLRPRIKMGCAPKGWAINHRSMRLLTMHQSCQNCALRMHSVASTVLKTVKQTQESSTTRKASFLLRYLMLPEATTPNRSVHTWKTDQIKYVLIQEVQIFASIKWLHHIPWMNWVASNMNIQSVSLVSLRELISFQMHYCLWREYVTVTRVHPAGCALSSNDNGWGSGRVLMEEPATIAVPSPFLRPRPRPSA